VLRISDELVGSPTVAEVRRGLVRSRYNVIIFIIQSLASSS
jgi:hypothetical protein